MSFLDGDKSALLLARIIAIHNAIKVGELDDATLKTISQLSTADIEAQADHIITQKEQVGDDSLKKIYQILTKAPPVTIQDAHPILEALKLFNEEHSEELPLMPLAADDTRTIANSLNDFATFYELFVKHMTCSLESGELAPQYKVAFDLRSAKADWLQWQNTRQQHVRFDPNNNTFPGIFEKFLAGTLQRDEWLTDLDLRRQLSILNIEPQVHVVPFKTEDIGLVLHFAREKHQLDDPKVPYVIPLIVNLGEDGHSRIDSQGAHWTRMLVSVDPTQIPPIIRVNYNDELFLPEVSKKAITATITSALQYRTELGGYSRGESSKIYQAFPECDVPTIQVDGSGEQRDGFTCGYRALRGIIEDLIASESITNNYTYQEFLACQDETSLRDFVYKSLLGQQLPKSIADGVFQENANGTFTLKPSIVTGQLLAFSQQKTQKTVKKSPLNPQLLEKIFADHEQMNDLRKKEKIKRIQNLQGPIELDANDILSDIDEELKPLALQVIFEEIAKNTQLTELRLTNFTYTPTKLIDSLPTRINLTSDDQNINNYLTSINLRNSLLKKHNIIVPADADPWECLFAHLLFDVSEIPIGSKFIFSELDATGFSKLLNYLEINEERFLDQNRYKELYIDGWEFLQAFKHHVTSKDSFMPFKKVHFNLNKINQDELISTISEILAVSKLDQLAINLDSLTNFSDEYIDKLIQLIKDNNYSTVIHFTDAGKTSRPKLYELENIALRNRRLEVTTSSEAPSVEPVIMGKIGAAIFNQASINTLDTESQVQEQQQQQVQQQVQSTLDDDDLPEEDELQEEAFTPYISTEDLIGRNDLDQIKDFIKSRHPHLEPTQCWDLITGAHADLFKYGIKKITRSALKILIENLQDVQYGLHPDNLPKGFSQQIHNGDVVLTYTEVNPPINLKASSLTISFSKPMEPNQWVGNALQFITQEQAENLYRSLKFKNQNKPGLEECINQCFFFKSSPSPLNDELQKYTIFKSFIDANAQKQIETLFGKKPSEANLQALSEVLYAQGPRALSTLLTDLCQIKQVKKDAFFNSFKTCFIDPSRNLNELTTESSRAAMQKLLTLSSAETTWWTSLTEQHSSNLLYNPEEKRIPGQRWANLAKLTEGFLYFCGKLEELSPGLKLTEHCPLTNVADMRTGLDGLLNTILPNALNINEQFYEGLEELPLGPLGPRYASRYEGFKLVTSDMLLDLENSYSERPDPEDKAKRNKLTYSENNFCFQCNKTNIFGNLADQFILSSKEKSKSLFMRYIATFNHRASMKQYREMFEELFIKDDYSRQFSIVILATFGTGKRGKYFTHDDIDNLTQLISKKDPYVKSLNDWQNLIRESTRLTIKEIVNISNLAISQKDAKKIINQIIQTIIQYNELQKKQKLESVKISENYLEAIVILTKNQQNLGLQRFTDIILNIENEIAKNNPLYKKLSMLKLPTRVATTKLLAVCNANDINDDNAQEIAENLYNAIELCHENHKSQITSDLLELLGNIDIEHSTQLPSLLEMIRIIENITTIQIRNYNTLEYTIKQLLPEGCIIQMEKITAAPVEPAGNLYMIILKYMAEIKTSLAADKDKIDLAFGQGFFDSLATPEGARILLDNLQNIAAQSSFIGEITKGQIKKVMLEVYESVINHGIDKFGIKNSQTKARLTKIIQQKIHHVLQQEKNFQDFCNYFPNELENLEKLLRNLQLLHQTWPNDFNEVLNVLDNSPNLKDYPVSLLEKITQSLLDNFDKSAPFPHDLLKQSLSLETESKRSQLCTILDDHLTAENLQFLNDTTKKLLYGLAIRSCNPEIIQTLLSFKGEDVDLFITRIKLVEFCEEINNECIQKIDENLLILTKIAPKIQTKTIDFFIKKNHLQVNPTDLQSALEQLQTIEDDNKKNYILAMAIQAAEQNIENYSIGLFQEVISNLNKLSDEKLQQLSDLYRSPRTPNLMSLNEIISAPDINLNQLQQEYDRDYWEKQNPAKFRDFTTSNLANYLDNLQDINYARPLLLSQREELQKWFLYINIIGDSRGIPTISGEYKPVKNMSHAEINDLINNYRDQLKDLDLNDDVRLKIKLQSIALLREAMYRATGKFPRATQILYLLTSMQNGQNFIAQIKTGEGKSLTAALAAVMENLDGQTVDLCTSNLFLASEGQHDHARFFEYLNIPTKLIHANSKKDEYTEGAIHYTTDSELALYTSKMQLFGKIFPKNRTIIVDEVDFVDLDNSTRSRYATFLDPVSDPHVSPYTWIYAALINFVDTQEAPKTDEEFVKLAKIWLHNSAKSKQEKIQLQALEKEPAIYKKRLETWLVAAGKTKQLLELEEKRFRVVTLNNDKYGQISKACILEVNRPNLQAELSNGLQQFLHMRLRAKYQTEIAAGTMPNFLVEPEKTYLTSLNSKLLLNKYTRRLGMSGTVGSTAEITEQHAKYGFRFVDIPPYTPSKLNKLDPIFTNAKYLTNPIAENRAHIQLIVQETLRYLRETKGTKPILIHCADQTQGEAIKEAITTAMRKYPKKYSNQIQSFYSSEKLTPEERNAEELTTKQLAGNDGMITISTVFSRGTDINPHVSLYTINTFIDTDPYSSEDLERSLTQKDGRAGRQGQEGLARTIAKRSEFLPQHRKIPANKQALAAAIAALNQVRNKKRMRERQLREAVDDIKDIIYQEFFQYIQAINASSAPKSAIRDELFRQWSLFLSNVDAHWEDLQHSSLSDEEILSQFRTFACEQWTAVNGALTLSFNQWVKHNQLEIDTPAAALTADKILEKIPALNKHLDSYYVKKSQQYTGVDPAKSADAVYCDFMPELADIRDSVITQYINQYDSSELPNEEKIQQIMAALLHSRYKAYRSGNPLAYAKLSNKCREFTEKMLWSGNKRYIQQIINAHEEHFTQLTNHRGQHEAQKVTYLSTLMSERRDLFPNELNKKDFQKYWKNNLLKQSQDWLTTYTKNWWSRSYVSSDRQKVAQEFINTLEENLTATDLLDNIATARNKLLSDDKSKSRSLKSGVEGRLYKYLNELELKVIAAMEPSELDAYRDKMLANISKDINKMGILRNVQLPEANYEDLSICLNNVANENLNIANWKTFQAYCQTTKIQLARYFAQCDQNRKLNQHGSISIYQAASEAAAANFQVSKSWWSATPKLTSVENRQFTYNDNTIQLTFDPLNDKIKKYPLFRQINQDKAYSNLLRSLEESIVEKSLDNPQIKFQKISLTMSDIKQTNIKLSIQMTINGEDSQIDYHINMANGAIYQHKDDFKLKYQETIQGLQGDGVQIGLRVRK